MELPEKLVDLLNSRCLCFLTTLMPDGSPQTTQTWAGTDGENVLINTVTTHQKVRNVRRDPRVAVAICDPDNTFTYFEIRGRVVGLTTEGATEHIDELSRKYTGGPYAWYGGREQERIKLVIAAERIHTVGR